MLLLQFIMFSKCNQQNQQKYVNQANVLHSAAVPEINSAGDELPSHARSDKFIKSE